MANPVFGTAARAKPAARTQRLFIALWPPTPLQQQIYTESARFAALGRRVPARNLHVTVAFLGSVAQDRIDTLLQVMREARPEACDLKLHTLAYSAKNRMLWMTPALPPASLAAYQSRLSRALGTAGFKTEERAYRPHITLLRDCARPTPEQLATKLDIAWPVREIALVRSDLAPGGSRYEVIGRIGASA